MTLPTARDKFITDQLNRTDRAVQHVDIAAIEKNAAVHRAAMDTANPPKPEPLRVELNRLRNKLFDLTQHVKNTEIVVNNCAGNAKLLEQRINDLLKVKRLHEDDGNLAGARTLEHQVQMLEDELADMRDRLTKEQNNESLAARQLRNWQAENGPRLKELQQQVV